MIASYLESYNADVKIIDMQAESEDFSHFETFDQPDYVGITSTTVTANAAYHVVSTIRDLWKDVKIVMGGVHATIAPKEILSNKAINYVIRGEGERSLAKLISGAQPEEIKGLAEMRDDGYWQHPETDFIEDLDEMPMPAYHLLPMDKYRPPLGGAIRQPTSSIFSTRGCPGKCTFCNSALEPKTRFRSPENVVKEIRYLIDQYGIREVSFYDDTFLAKRRRVQEICHLLIREKVDITWTCMSRINYADFETLQLMSKAGCHMVCYGVESADEQILRNIKKGIKLQDVKKVVEMTKKAGIRTRLSFMFGNPGETIETMQKSYQFAIDSDPDMVQFNITTPYPGTEMYKWADANGYLITKDWAKYDLYNIVMRLPTVSPDEIHNFYHFAYRRFFFRPSYIIKQLVFYLRHLDILKYSITNLFSFIKTILRIN